MTPPFSEAPVVPSRGALLAYGGLALPWCLAGLPILTYLPAFYAQELRLSAGLVGAVFLGARLWDGLFDLLIGWLSDRSRSRFGRRKPFVILAAPALMVSTWYLCNPPAGAGLAYLGWWAALFYTAWTALGIPYVSWGAELAGDYVERSRVTAYREGFSMAGNLFFASAPLIFLSPDAPLRDAVFLIALTVLVLLPLTVTPLALFVRDARPATERAPTPVLKELATLAQDRVLRRFILANLCLLTANGVSNSLAVFSLSVGLALPHKLFWVIFVIYVAALATLPLTLWLGRRMDKHRLFVGALAVQALVYLAMTVIPAGNLALVLTLWAVLGVGSAAWFILPTSMLADMIDHGEVMSGERRSGTYVAVYNLAVKVGLALGVGLAFGLLELIDYEPVAASHSAADALNIRLLGYGLPALLLAAGAALLLRYPITKAVQHRLRAKIEARQGAHDVAEPHKAAATS